jgi:hypothetical protein
MRTNKILLFSIVVFSFLLFIACKPSAFDNCIDIPSFNGQIQPIIMTNCATASCHGFGGFAPFQLMTYEQIDSVAMFGSLLMAIKHQTPKPMPRTDPFLPDATRLPDSLIQIIECWVNQGRPNN